MNSIFQQLIQLAQNNGLMFVLIVIITFVAIFILTILLLNPKKQTRVNAIKTTHSVKKDSPILNQDIRAISGDDVFVTQLDLARAYIELGNIMLAKQILESVIHQGNDQQIQSAQELLLAIPK
jgi:FimV-like protein